MVEIIDSESVGDPRAFGTRDELEAAYLALASTPRDRGLLMGLFRRVKGGRRERLEVSELGQQVGVHGDSWENHPRRKPGEQIAAMQWSVAQIIARGQPIELAGDQMYLDLDLSVDNLPAGSRIRIGEAEVEVSNVAHMGCAKFAGRFGKSALGWTLEPALRARRLRGLYLMVRVAGRVHLGDEVMVLSRPA
jgi:hypothetical protein